VTQCTAASPCIIGTATFVTGNICTAPGSSCGYISTCIDRLIPVPGPAGAMAPDCDCALF
jgi:hypothetical protein